MSFSGLIASAPSAVIDSKPTRSRIAIVDWYSRSMKLCGMMHVCRVGDLVETVRVSDPIRDEPHADPDQRHRLDHEDRDRRHRRARDSSIRDVAGDHRERRSRRCPTRSTKACPRQPRAVDVPEERRREGDHDPRIDPVVQVADPADAQLREPSETPMGRARFVEQGSLGEVVAGAGARIRIDARQLAVAVRREQRQDEREQQPRPHVGRGGRAAPRERRLCLEGRPEERSRRDQRHRVHRDARERQTASHLPAARGGGLRHRGSPLSSAERMRRRSEAPRNRRLAMPFGRVAERPVQGP